MPDIFLGNSEAWNSETQWLSYCLTCVEGSVLIVLGGGQVVKAEVSEGPRAGQEVDGGYQEEPASDH